MHPMYKHIARSAAVALCLAAAGLAQTAAAPNPGAHPLQAPVPAMARVVHYLPNQIVPIRAKVRYTTLIVLPPQEKILDYTTGDKDYWIINGVENFCFLHPAKVGIASNLNLITSLGHVYSFTLREISKVPGAEPDLKVVIEPKNQAQLTAVSQSQGLAPASEVEAYRAEAQAARAAAVKAEEAFRAQYPLRLRFDYRFRRFRPPFYVQAIYEDGRFTYIRMNAPEKPALYALKDGKASLVNFEVRGGTYIVSPVLDQGYLQIGKKKLRFYRAR